MAITTYVDFVNNYLVKNGMIGNATNINKAPDQLKLELDEINLDNSADNILVKLKTVDGAGSGLDADLLDGMNATNANTATTVVSRDASGNFSAGIITAALSGNANTATKLATARKINGVAFDGSADINIEDRLGTAIASAATTTVGTAGLGDYMHITGTTTITSFGTAASAGTRRTLIFDGALTVTHNATSLICPGDANIVTEAGTVIEIIAETTANWRVVSINHPSIFTELSYLDGATSNIQTQLNTKVVRDLGIISLQAVVGSNASCTTAQFITWLKGIGAFSSTSSRLRFTWDHAGNNIISDLPDGTLSTAGSQVDISNDGTDKYTITIITPNSHYNSTIPGGSIYVYNTQGVGYASGWRRVYTSLAYGVATHINSTTLDSTGRNMHLSGKLSSSGIGNDYSGSGLETRGDGSSIYPSISFHQPGVYANTIRNTNGGLFEFMRQDNASYTDIRADLGRFAGVHVNQDGNGSHIHMYDTDEGIRHIHCNSNRIGFLNQAGDWGAWCNDDGSWETSGVSKGGFGFGQTWQNVVASRASGVTYTNSTARPIEVSAWTWNWSDGFIWCYVNELAVAHNAGHSEYGHEAGASFIVPPGATYRIDIVGLKGWAELR